MRDREPVVGAELADDPGQLIRGRFAISELFSGSAGLVSLLYRIAAKRNQ